MAPRPVPIEEKRKRNRERAGASRQRTYLKNYNTYQQAYSNSPTVRIIDDPSHKHRDLHLQATSLSADPALTFSTHEDLG